MPVQIGDRQKLHIAVTQHITTLRIEATATRERTVNLPAGVSKHPGTVVYRGKSAVMLKSVVRSLVETRTLALPRAMYKIETSAEKKDLHEILFSD